LHPVADVSRMRYALLGLSEVAVACADFPICLAKEADTGRFNLITLFSLDEPRNLFWFGGGWQATYLPRAATTAPFLLDSNSPLGLAVDEGSPRLGREGMPLFEQDGRPAKVLIDARSRLERLTSDVADAQVMVDRFAELRLVRPLVVVLTRGNGAQHQVDGLYSLSSQALAALDDQAVVDLYRRGYLAAASLMLASLNQMERLRQLHRATGAEPLTELAVQVVEP
jgi:hypothetical protein